MYFAGKVSFSASAEGTVWLHTTFWRHLLRIMNIYIYIYYIIVQIRSQNHRKFVRPQHPNTLLEPHQASRMHRPLATAKSHRITESSQNCEPNVEVRQEYCQLWPAEHASTRLLSVYSVLPASTSFPLALSLSLSTHHTAADLQPPLQVKLLISGCEFTDLILCFVAVASSLFLIYYPHGRRDNKTRQWVSAKNMGPQVLS